MVSCDENIRMASTSTSTSISSNAAASAQHQVTSGLLSLKHGAPSGWTPAASSAGATQMTDTRAQFHTKHVEFYPEDQPSPVSSEEQAARGFAFPELHYNERGHALQQRGSFSNSTSSSPSRSQSGIPRVPLFNAQTQQPVLTPVTRFLTKESYGFIPRASTAMSPSSMNREHSNSAGFLRDRTPSRLPSLKTCSPNASHNALPSIASCQISSPSAGCRQVLFPEASAVSIPSFNPSSDSNALPSLPSLSRSGVRPPLRGPVRYQRSLSCPSDHPMMEPPSPPPSISFSMVPIVTQSGYPKARLERSSSMDLAAQGEGNPGYWNGTRGLPSQPVSPFLPQVENRYRWFGSPSQGLESLAESAVQSSENISPLSASAASTSEHKVLKTSCGEARREKKLCAYDNCTSNAVTRGLCISHGGGRRCQRKGCTRGAQSKGLCVAHGGGRICRERGCTNIQRSMGLCIRHGGGKRCSVPGCQKGVVRQDLCTAHGGKRKCKVDDCNKHVKKKGLCRSHANSLYGTHKSMQSVRSPSSPLERGDQDREMDTDSEHSS